jgi:hypothetical protein
MAEPSRASRRPGAPDVDTHARRKGDQSMSGDPPNIQEFNTIAGLVFAQLYETFPSRKNIDYDRVARGMGVEGNDWSAHKLPSGRGLRATISETIDWLNAEEFIRSHGLSPSEQVTLTTKGRAVMNAVPEGLKEKLGVELTKAVDQKSYSGIGDLIGGILGGFTKSMGS